MASPSTPRCLIVALPDEILEQILLGVLDKTSLNAVVRTCHRLHEVGIPMLWRNISYNNSLQYHRIRDEITRDPRKGELVRTLRADSSEESIRLRWQIWHPNFLIICPNLEELTLCGFPDAVSFHDRFQRFRQALEDFGAILSRSLNDSAATHLRSCYLSFWDDPRPNALADSPHGHAFWDPSAIMALFAHPTLQDLSLDAADFPKEINALFEGEPFATRRQSTPLQRLCLKRTFIEDSTLKLILRMPKALKEFYFLELDEESDPYCDVGIEEACVKRGDFNLWMDSITSTQSQSLRKLHLIFNESDEVWTIHSDTPMTALREFSNLRHLVIEPESLRMVGEDPTPENVDLPAEKFIQHLPPYLEILEIGRPLGWDSSWGMERPPDLFAPAILELLEKHVALLPSLKRLVLTQAYRPKDYEQNLREQIYRACQLSGIELSFNKRDQKILTHPWNDDRGVEVAVGMAADVEGYN